MKTTRLLLAGIGCLMLSATAIAATPQHGQHALKVGKKGQITLTQQTKAGDKVLQADTYVVQHRVSAGNHFVRFIELKTLQDLNTATESTEWYTYTEPDNVAEIKCQVEPATEPIKKTTVYTINEGGIPRITKVAIKGESVWHIL